MINQTLYTRGLRESLKTLLIFMAVLAMYFTIIISMYDPVAANALDEFAKVMPEMMEMFGMTTASGELVSFLSAYLYGFIVLVFPMIFSILAANRLMAKHVDRGSMTFLLSAPVKRKTVAITQIAVLCSGIFALSVFMTVLGIVVCEISFLGKLAIGSFILMNLGVLCLQLFIGSICFFCSSFFGDSRYALGVGAGIPALGFVLQVLGNAGKELKNIKYATFFTLFDPKGIVAGEPFAYAGIPMLFAGAAVIFILSTVIFSKKDLHI